MVFGALCTTTFDSRYFVKSDEKFLKDVWIAITSWQIDGETVADFILGGSKITAGGDCSHEIKRRLLLGRKVMTKLDSIFKSRDYFVNKGPSSQSYGFSSSHVWMWELDYKESWAQKGWYFWTVVLEKTLESPLDCKAIQPIHPKGNHSWVLIGRTDVEAETSIFWPPDARSWLIWKDPDVGKDWRQEEKGMTEDEMVRWHHGLNGHEFGWTPGVGDGQGGLVCCSSWGHKKSDTTEQLDWYWTDTCRKVISPSEYPKRTSETYMLCTHKSINIYLERELL